MLEVDMQTRSQAQASKNTAPHRPGLARRAKNASQRPVKKLLESKRRRTPSSRVSQCGNSAPQPRAKDPSAPLSSQTASSNLTYHQRSGCSSQLLTLEQIAQLCLSGLPQPSTKQSRTVAVNAENSTSFLTGSCSLPNTTSGRLTMPYLDPSQ